METTIGTISVTAIATICLYIADFSLWWALVVPAAALVIWLYEIYHRSKIVFSLIMLMLDIIAYFYGVSLWWVLGIPAGFVALGSVYYAIISRHQQGRKERHHRASVHTYSVPSHRSRTVDERTSLLPSYPRLLPTETPSRVASQSFSRSQSSFDGTPSVLRIAPASSFRLNIDRGLSRYTLPTIPSPVIVHTRHTLHPNPNQPARNIPALVVVPVVRQEMGGLFLHKKVAAVIVDRYQYDQKLNVKGNPYIAVLVTGFFKCYNCKPKKHQPKKLRIWRSDAICVEIWMLSSGHEYRTRLHFQICEDCNTFVKPEVIEDDYVTMVVTELDRWTGQSSEVKPRQKYFKTGLHRKAKCGACLKGVCPLKPAK